ncbi:MAG: hypothetical protein WCI74_20010 [Actinomycetes bacterium]
MADDPNLHWDGSRWLRWDGSGWVDAAAGATGAPAPVTQKRASTGLFAGLAVAAVALVVIAVVAVVVLTRNTSDTTVTAPNTVWPSITATVPTVAAAPTVTVTPTPVITTTVPAPVPEPELPLNDVNAAAFVTTFLNAAKAGDVAQARAMTSSTFASRKTADFYALAARELGPFSLVSVEGNPTRGYSVFVKEKWTSGTWTNWYRVVKVNGKLVIDDTGTE